MSQIPNLALKCFCQSTQKEKNQKRVIDMQYRALVLINNYYKIFIYIIKFIKDMFNYKINKIKIIFLYLLYIIYNFILKYIYIY